jgi:uncharacterized cupredoxin-like copper-binding protein
MKSVISTCILCFCIAWPATEAQADIKQIGQPHDRAYEMPDHQPIGRPAVGSDVTETIELTIEETASGYMLFKPDAIRIEKGSVVRFVINNEGALDHEFFLGSFNEISKHEQWMRTYPEMEHDDANAVAVSSGAQAELIWEFSSMTNLEFVCLVPGHREAGMWGVILAHDHLAPKRKK